MAQIAISILMSASACPYRSGSEADRYLWGHQRATSKARLWFSSIDHTEQAKLAASLWYRQKAQELSRLQGEETFYRRLVGPSDRLEEDLVGVSSEWPSVPLDRLRAGRSQVR